MVDDGWGELDAEEAAMSAADRANVRESVTRAWTRLDRARAVLDGINSVDLAMQRQDCTHSRVSDWKQYVVYGSIYQLLTRSNTHQLYFLNAK